MGLQFHDTLSSLIYKYVRSNVKIFSQIFDTFLYDGTVIKEILQKVQCVFISKAYNRQIRYSGRRSD